MREKLPNRREGITERLTYRSPEGRPFVFDVTYGFEYGGQVKECFTLHFKVGTDIQDLMHQGCIAISIALQSGQSMATMARIMGEDSPDQPPHSMLGLVVRAGVVLDAHLAECWEILNPIPKPAKTAAAVVGAENVGPKEVGPAFAVNVGDVKAGLRTAAVPVHANVSAGVTAGRVPAPELDATPAGAVVAARSGATGGESAAPVSNAGAMAGFDLVRDIPAFLRRSLTPAVVTPP